MTPSVQEVKPEVAENIGDDLFAGITGDLFPGSQKPQSPSVPQKPKQQADQEFEDGDAGEEQVTEGSVPPVDVSDLSPKKATAKPVEAKKEQPAPESEEPQALNPADLVDASALSGDKLPEDLIKEEDASKVFKADPRAKDAFLKERAYNKTLRSQLKETQSALAAAKADVASIEELEKTKAELDSYKSKIEKLETEIGQLDLSKSSSFRQQYDDKINQLGSKMVEVIVSEGVEQPEAVGFVQRLISEQKHSSRERLINDMVPGLRGTLSSLGIQIDEVVQARTKALENWKATSAALQETTARTKAVQFSEKIEEYVSSAVDEAKKLGNPYYMETKDPQWNAGVAERQEVLKGILLSGDMEKLASLVAEGLTASDLRVRYGKLLKQKKELDAELASVLKGSPKFSSRAQSPAASAPPKEVVGGIPLEDAITSDLLPPKR